MKGCLSTFLLSCLLLLLVPSSTAPAGGFEPYADCAPMPYSCGKVEFSLSYPFRVEGRHDYCGHPAYHLNCTDYNATLVLSISNKPYQVMGVDVLNNLVRVVDTSFIGQSCPNTYKNITMDFTNFGYSDRNQNLTLYLNCTAPPTTAAFYEIECLYDNTGLHSYYRLDSQVFTEPLCSSTVVIPLIRDAANLYLNGNLSFGAALQEGFVVESRAGKGWCDGCLRSSGFCGYNTNSPAEHTCYCRNGMAMDGGGCEGNNSGRKNWKKIKISVASGILGFLFVLLLVLLLYRKISNSIEERKNWPNGEAFMDKNGSLALKRYKYSSLKKMTNSFHDKLGHGGYGTVFKGVLPDGSSVAVKLLNKSKGNGEEFVNEVACIGRTSHVNIVRLLGFCLDGTKRALVYEYMANGSLEKFIFSDRSKVNLGWEKLHEIATGIARGLEYLHRGCNTRIVHFDIKPHNILLDGDFHPKISDFGLAKLCPQQESVLSMAGARGTVGYIAPEVFSRSFGVVTSKSDVYSYGMMVLEMVGGRKNINVGVDHTSEIYFPHWIYQHLERDDDLRAYGVTTETEELARKMILVGLWCIQTLPGDRPSMTAVVDMLGGSIKDLQMPPKPYLSSPSRSPVVTSVSVLS